MNDTAPESMRERLSAAHEQLLRADDLALSALYAETYEQRAYNLEQAFRLVRAARAEMEAVFRVWSE